eukprot:CAMPEP_0174709476 /NCGR_PEP_ID=MMETSP1094-20130205/11416_1 /TAXON_ID=156173 /ORGANISM="Chrysochromulina brevifilum, Strain UTEX LB 985" /LENGTH=118 /DNA_ID=CAMNT_0015908159 /DNA_START=181 /DNA_END=537 /DNA_ORIENTATION=-
MLWHARVTQALEPECFKWRVLHGFLPRTSPNGVLHRVLYTSLSRAFSASGAQPPRPTATEPLPCQATRQSFPLDGRWIRFSQSINQSINGEGRWISVLPPSTPSHQKTLHSSASGDPL